MIRISVIVVTYNSETHIRKCLDSFLNEMRHDWEVLVIDNASVDDTRRILQGYSQRIRLMVNEHNRGYAAAINQGIRAATGEFLLVLNADIILEKGFLEEAVRIVAQLPHYVGMVCPKILKVCGKIIDSTGLILTSMRRFYDRGSGEVDKGQFDAKQENVFGPCAAAALYRKAMLDQLKMGEEYFDADFFMILEDFDVAWRAKRSGWGAMYVPELVCYHHGGISRHWSSLAQYYAFRNRYLLLLKNEKKSNVWRLFLFAFVYDFPRFIFLLCSNKYTMQAVRELILLAPHMLQKRKNTTL